MGEIKAVNDLIFAGIDVVGTQEVVLKTILLYTQYSRRKQAFCDICSKKLMRHCEIAGFVVLLHLYNVNGRMDLKADRELQQAATHLSSVTRLKRHKKKRKGEAHSQIVRM